MGKHSENGKKKETFRTATNTPGLHRLSAERKNGARPTRSLANRLLPACVRVCVCACVRACLLACLRAFENWKSGNERETRVKVADAVKRAKATPRERNRNPDEYDRASENMNNV